MSVLSRRIGALVASAAVVLSGATFIQPAGAVVLADPRPVDIGATWLEGQLTDGLMYNPNYGGFNDYGLSIDTGFALAEVGGHAATVSTIADALAPYATEGYAQGDEYQWQPPYDFVQRGYYAGPTAKALVFAQVAGQDPTTWATANLVTATEDRVAGPGPILGRIVDDSSYGNYANTIGQAFAARGLSAAGSGKAADVVSFLLDQQCSEGFFRLNLNPDLEAADQSCDGGIAAGQSAPDLDATAEVVVQLLASGLGGPEVTAALDAAESWIAAQQRGDGSFGGGTSTAAANVNSTGLAGVALGMLGRTTAAKRAAVWVRWHQADDLGKCTSALSADRGAIAYNKAAFAAGSADGIVDATVDQWRRASTQSLAVLQWAPAASRALALTGPDGFVRGGGTARFRATGLVPGESVCISGAGRHVLGHARWGGGANLRVSMPSATADRVFTARDRSGDTSAVQVRILGATTLAVRSRARVSAGAAFWVKVTGLVPGEQVRIRWGRATVAMGRANPDGALSRRITATGPTGKRRIVAWGEFPAIRSGATSVRVLG